MCKILFVLIVVISLCYGENTTDIPSPKFATPCSTPNQDTGFCLELHKCHVFKNQHITDKHKAWDFIKASNCGPSNAKIEKICCGKFDNFIVQIEKNSTITEEPTTTSKPKPDNPLPKKCGTQKVQIFSRIFGGEEAVLGEFPWVVRLMHRSKYGYRNYGCGGVLIHRKFVLTAAHCVYSEALQILGPIFQVVLGEHDINTLIDCTNTTRPICADAPIYIATGKPVVYAGYTNNSNEHNNDIALIPLKQSVQFNDFVQPICLSDKSINAPLMWIAGWGKTEMDETSDVKLKVEVPAVSHQVCFDKYQSIGVSINKKTQVCAGAVAGKDSCAGDSGGPLMGDKDNIWYAEGLVSFGVGCGKEGWPGIYTYLPKYYDWIKKTIARKLSKQRKRRN